MKSPNFKTDYRHEFGSVAFACEVFLDSSTFFIDFQQLEHRLILPRSALVFQETVGRLPEVIDR
jgi:hypothetical protein